MPGTSFKRPSAWLPLAMSGAALALVLGYVALHGVPHQPEADEGTPAHLYQLLMAGQVPIVLYFAATRLPENGREAIKVLGLQFLAALAAFAALFIMERLG